MKAPAGPTGRQGERRKDMSVYRFIDLVGTSSESWEKAAAIAVETASKSLRELRVAEVREMDVTIENGKIALYRTKLRLSFKYEGS
jgi:flavin-binding protein dodecin